MHAREKKIERCLELIYRFRHLPNREHLTGREIGWTWLIGEIAADERRIFGCEDEEPEEGEEWKNAAGYGDEELSQLWHCEYLPVFRFAQEFALRALRLVDSLPEPAHLNSAVVDFVSNAMSTPGNIARGAAIGEDPDDLGGNIAYSKRGLAAANLSIAALREMKLKRILEGNAYLMLAMEAAEVRDAIALHVADLRDRFQRRG